MKLTPLSLLIIVGLRLADPDVDRVIDHYVEAVGGAQALGLATTRVTRGTFNNGRGLVEPFVTSVSRPNQIATIIGRRGIDEASGSGRGYDGRIGWDKNFIGTGLREVTGVELADLARTANPFRAAHLRETCLATQAEPVSAGGEPRLAAIRCDLADRVERWYFDEANGLLGRLESTTANGRTVTTYFEDYRRVDGILTPFRERIVTPGAAITYTAASIRYNEAVAASAFASPER